jgi:hypothetical protein
MKRFSPLPLLLLASCGLPTTPTLEVETEVEAKLLSETSRFAQLLYVNVRGEITDREHPGGAAAGWLEGGVAYYNRAQVAKWISLLPEAGKEAASNVAAHEVCHTQSRNHDLLHWNCSFSVGAQPTYPRP